MLAAHRRQIANPGLHLAAIGLFAICAIANIAHFQGSFAGNPLTWAAWLLAVAAYTVAFVPIRRPRLATSLGSLRRSELAIGLAILVVYAVSHLWNFGSAPWNTNGLFDDAAWDIYFARIHAFNGPYQAAFYDQVGVISRETAFHYYVTAFFKLFGYNLLVFNIALLVLGFVTVLFTTLAVHRLFRNLAVTIAAGLVLNFLPLHYLQVFVGHRYAIAAPLMMVSLYFMYSGSIDRSFARLSVSGVFAALCLGSAIMGKQVILGLALAAVLLAILDRRRWFAAENRAAGLAWTLAFLIGATPLLVYILFNPADYFRRESGLISDFGQIYATQGYDGIRPFVDQLGELFFAKDTFRRMWLHGFPIVPPAYWLLLAPGLIIALVRRRVEIVLLAAIPVGSAFLSGAYDFRVLLAAPIWVLAMAYTLDFASFGRLRPRAWRPIANVALAAILVAGLVPSAAYVWGVSTDSRAQYLLSHRDVAVSRLIQDVVAGAAQPTADMKSSEFDRPEAAGALGFDSLACAERAYAIAHLYLQAFDDRRVMTLCDQGNESLVGKDKLFAVSAKAIADYVPRGKALKMIWEEPEVAQTALKRFATLERYGSSQRLTGSVDGESFSIWVLTIAPENIAGFQAAVAKSAAGGE